MHSEQVLFILLHLIYPENINCQNQISFRGKVYLILFSLTGDFPFLDHKKLACFIYRKFFKVL